MIAEALKTRLKASPFVPFVVRLSSGASYAVEHPEFVSLSPGGRHMILWVGEDRYVDIDVLLIESVEAKAAGSRRRRSA